MQGMISSKPTPVRRSLAEMVADAEERKAQAEGVQFNSSI